MKTLKHLNESALALVAILVSLLIINILPQSSDFNCGFMGICPTWPENLKGFVFVFLCLIIGPKRIVFFIAIFIFTMFWSVVMLFASGEAQLQMISSWLPAIPFSPIFHGGLAGGVIAYLAMQLFSKYMAAHRDNA
jgi:hypothetical protein